MSQTLFIIDIDGTISHGGRRFVKAGKEPSKHDKEVYNAWVERVNSGMVDDKPVPGMVDVCIALDLSHYPLMYVTSREEKHREDTEEWISQNGFPPAPVIMRPSGNWDEVAEFKEKMIHLAQALHRAISVVVIDDDPGGDLEVMCRKNGYTFLKARSGGQL